MQCSPTSRYASLVPASSTAVVACLSANSHFRHSCLQWKHWCHGFCPSLLHNEDIRCMSTTSEVLSLVSAWLPTSGLFTSSQEAGKKREMFVPCILQSAFSPPEQPLCRDNAATLRSLSKISLGRILFAIAKELLEGLLGSGPTLFHGKRTVEGNPVCLVLLGNETLVPCRPLRKPIFSKDGYM